MHSSFCWLALFVSDLVALKTLLKQIGAGRALPVGGAFVVATGRWILSALCRKRYQILPWCLMLSAGGQPGRGTG